MNGRSSARWSLQGVAPLQGSLMAGALASYATEMVDLGAILLASGGRGNRYRSRHHPPAQNGFGAGLESGHPAKRRQECEGMQAIASKLVTDLLATSFMGPYMRPAAQDGAREQDQGSGAVRRQQVFMTLGHWWHAAKFMPRHPDLRDAVLDSVSLKEASRMSQKNKAHWRTDWERHGVMAWGAGMLALQPPELGLRDAPLAAVAEGLKPLRLPQIFIRYCLATSMRGERPRDRRLRRRVVA
jgi:hypothetical protein